MGRGKRWESPFTHFYLPFHSNPILGSFTYLKLIFEGIIHRRVELLNATIQDFIWQLLSALKGAMGLIPAIPPYNPKKMFSQLLLVL